MRLEYQVLAAFMLDLVLGDPRWFPHPVKLMGSLAGKLESPLRKSFSNQKVAGAVAVLVVLSVTGGLAWLALFGASKLHPYFADSVSILLLYATLATRDLRDHALKVHRALRSGDLEKARQKLAMIVGRDTTNLSEEEVSRAAVETVAENTTDGVTSPLFYGLLFGPIGALVYKAINTMDSMFGYLNDRYRDFGLVPARLDDVANFIPARITGLLISLCSALLGLTPGRSLKIFFRDRKAHTSPNAGHTEAAMAGALGIQLGGGSVYKGITVQKPTMGEPENAICMTHIRGAARLMVVTAAVATVFGIVLRYLVTMLPIGALSLGLFGCQPQSSKAQMPDENMASCERIISLAPSLTETVFALGLGERLVGVTRFCDYPVEAKSKKVVGGYVDPNYEIVTSLNPDVVLLLEHHGLARDRLATLGIKTHTSDSKSVLNTIQSIGKLCNVTERATELTSSIEKRLAAVKQKTAGLGRPKVLVSVGRSMGSGSIKDIYVAGHGSLFDELVVVAGGQNAFKGAAASYARMSAEGVLELNPDIIVDLVVDLDEKGIAATDVVKQWDVVDRTNAVKSGRVYVLSNGYVVVPGPRIVLLVEELAKLFHPDANWN